MLSNDISAATFRIASFVKQPKLKAELESAAVDLVIKPFEESIIKLESIVRLGESIGEIKAEYAKVLYRELDNLRLEEANISISGNSKKETELEKFNIEEYFSQDRQLMRNEEAVISGNPEKSGSLSLNNPSNQENISQEKEEISEKTNLNTERMNAIVVVIRKTDPILGGCKIKDLMAAFPDVSDRTIRYDLQKLSEQGAVERVGKGPSSYYRLKKTSRNGSLQITNEVADKRNQGEVFTL